jgi:DNA-binding MarR family transcriptional regulator
MQQLMRKTAARPSARGVAVRMPKALDLGICRGCLCLNLRMASRVVTQRFDEALAAVDLRATQYTAMDRSTLSRNLRPLMARGLVRQAPGANGRQRQLELTSKGLDLLRKAVPIWRTTQAALVREIGGEARWQPLLLELRHTIKSVQTNAELAPSD